LRGAYAGFNRLYGAGRKPGPIIEAACWAHARRQFFDLARLAKAPIAIDAVERIDALFAIEREINANSVCSDPSIRSESHPQGAAASHLVAGIQSRPVRCSSLRPVAAR